MNQTKGRQNVINDENIEKKHMIILNGRSLKEYEMRKAYASQQKECGKFDKKN